MDPSTLAKLKEQYKKDVKRKKNQKRMICKYQTYCLASATARITNCEGFGSWHRAKAIPTTHEKTHNL